MTIKLMEGFDHGDLEHILLPHVSVDEYEAKMGENADVITLAFIVNNEQAGKDLSGWFERGYDWVLDAKVSEGELSKGKYLVFVEFNRRRSSPERIVQLIEDLETLTNVSVSDWTVKVDDEEHPANAEVLSKVIITSPQEYREKKESEDELNDMRGLAGLDNKDIYGEPDEEIRNMKTIAGL